MGARSTALSGTGAPSTSTELVERVAGSIDGELQQMVGSRVWRGISSEDDEVALGLAVGNLQFLMGREWSTTHRGLVGGKWEGEHSGGKGASRMECRVAEVL